MNICIIICLWQDIREFMKYTGRLYRFVIFFLASRLSMIFWSPLPPRPLELFYFSLSACRLHSIFVCSPHFLATPQKMVRWFHPPPPLLHSSFWCVPTLLYPDMNIQFCIDAILGVACADESIGNRCISSTYSPSILVTWLDFSQSDPKFIVLPLFFPAIVSRDSLRHTHDMTRFQAKWSEIHGKLIKIHRKIDLKYKVIKNQPQSDPKSHIDTKYKVINNQRQSQDKSTDKVVKTSKWSKIHYDQKSNPSMRKRQVDPFSHTHTISLSLSLTHRQCDQKSVEFIDAETLCCHVLPP